MTAVTDTSGAADAPVRVGVAIIGAGFSGLGAAIKLTQHGFEDVLLLDRGTTFGGTWRDNTYPGAACDVPSHLYSYSFEPNPGWSRSYGRGPEIHAYIERVAAKYDIASRTRFSTEVTEAHWDDAEQAWRLATSTGPVVASFLVGAVGPLCEPKLPEIDGIEDFGGEVFHSARWNHDYDLTGKRVAVIGTGASAVQIIPELAGTVGRLDVYQRTAPWVLPRTDRPYLDAERTLFRRTPIVQKTSRTAIYAGHELVSFGLTYRPNILKPLEWLGRANIARAISDPELRAKVTPRWKVGCKRMLLSNTYYPALARENVDVVTDPIAKITPTAVVTKDGTVREIDALVVATGFHVTDSPAFATIHGADGRSLADVWAEGGMTAYKGSAVHGFPNLFLMVGPSTGLGHTSMIFMIESQLNYLIGQLSTMRERGLAAVDVRAGVQRDYNEGLQKTLADSVWETGGCSSWYKDRFGNITTLWPGFTFVFRRATRTFDLPAYDAVPAHTRVPVRAAS